MCKGFEKIIFQGQLCYSLNMGKLKTPKINSGRKNSLKIIIDSNKERASIRKNLERQTTKKAVETLYTTTSSEQRSFQTVYSVNQEPTLENLPSLEAGNATDNDIRIHINNVKPFTDYGGGQYIVTSVKQMTTTSDFDKFPENIKNCQNTETTEECSHKKLMVGAAEKCGCLPAIVNQFKNLQQVFLVSCF